VLAHHRRPGVRPSRGAVPVVVCPTSRQPSSDRWAKREPRGGVLGRDAERDVAHPQFLGWI